MILRDLMLNAHPLRQQLNDELYARPPVPISAPAEILYVAYQRPLRHGEDDLLFRGQERTHLETLCQHLGLALPDAETQGGQLLLECPGLSLKWEAHNEFSSYTLIHTLPPGVKPASPVPAVMFGKCQVREQLPQSWLATLPGPVLAAVEVDLRSIADTDPEQVLASHAASGQTFVTSRLGGGEAWLFTDFKLHEGFSRFVVIDEGLKAQRAGRTVQRLLEIEIYRIMALLAFPVAKEVARLITRAEQQLAALIDRIGSTRTVDGDNGSALLSDLTLLAAEVEHSLARSTFRFGAAAAYYRLVQQRIADLKESRISGYPNIKGFMERRLAPALNTCASIAQRQEDLSSRIARTSELLRTQVNVVLERQNQELLSQMNRRAKLQLHLQSTVEGLSVVVLTYYGSQLVQYLAKGLKGVLPWSPEGITAASIPVIASIVAWGTHRMHQKLAAEEGEH